MRTDKLLALIALCAAAAGALAQGYPANPIRITVINGHVILSGVVDSQADKNVAGIQANTVPGVFSVTNNLQVAGQPEEKPQ